MCTVDCCEFLPLLVNMGLSAQAMALQIFEPGDNSRSGGISKFCQLSSVL